jgi:hypothetical protein
MQPDFSPSDSEGENTMGKFDRKFQAIASLEAMPDHEKPRWWKDLLSLWQPSGNANSEQTLRLAVRNNYLNFYLKGQSVARVDIDRYGKIRTSVHVRYASQGAPGEGYAKLTDVDINIPGVDAPRPYIGLETLREWMDEAKKRTGQVEKSLIEKVVKENSSVIDLEMGLPAYPGKPIKLGNDNPSADRIDIVTLEPLHKGAQIVFWEAKWAGARGDLVASGDATPKIVGQLKRYTAYLVDDFRCKEIVSAYREACRLMVKFAKMAEQIDGVPRALDPLIGQFVNESIEVSVNTTPQLLIFGKPEDFDRDNWKMHRAKLTEVHKVNLHEVINGTGEIKLRAKGDTL